MQNIINFDFEWQYKIYKFCYFLIKTLQPTFLLISLFLLISTLGFNLFNLSWWYILIIFSPSLVTLIVCFLIILIYGIYCLIDNQ